MKFRLLEGVVQESCSQAVSRVQGKWGRTGEVILAVWSVKVVIGGGNGSSSRVGDGRLCMSFLSVRELVVRRAVASTLRR